jgi:hypothetical protein
MFAVAGFTPTARTHQIGVDHRAILQSQAGDGVGAGDLRQSPR